MALEDVGRCWKMLEVFLFADLVVSLVLGLGKKESLTGQFVSEGSTVVSGVALSDGIPLPSFARRKIQSRIQQLF